MAWPAHSHRPGWQTESSAIHLRQGAAALLSAPHGRAQGERCDVSNGSGADARVSPDLGRFSPETGLAAQRPRGATVAPANIRNWHIPADPSADTPRFERQVRV